MLKLIAIAAIFATPVLAQDAVQGPNPDFLQHAINALQMQRNRALDEAAGAEAQLAQVQKVVADLQKQLADVKAKAKSDEVKP